MTVGSLLSALAVGALVGALGRLAIPGPRRVPRWLGPTIGVAAALAGTIATRLAGVDIDTGADAGVPGLRELLVQTGAAGAAVGFAVTATGRAPRTHPRYPTAEPSSSRRPQEGPTR
ncbi:hypothetical protein [Micromonospora echinofusca]|uniref:GlsB/YeaQ/YmgE family stress response membrane protein n=1 Tax=Micromonospora echinofusca TaxID=47858 RepID=A0ABS3VR48_MICEH|nr:hypothetical protein [Micromonospora echinofusca]MBO4207012.1 hypothetical protein [Micromonospora echinofusca]